jgi:anaerobic ribonucleoside-triphosphate reductase activating protein
MLVHSMLPRSVVNGPGERAVVWLQGCDLRCRGCFNPASHLFNRDRDKPVEEVAEWILSCQGIEGVTFSGGEPFQQADDLRRLCGYIKLGRPDFSIGVFSGYTLEEFVCGRWHWKAPGADGWITGDPDLFEEIRRFLDFGVFGRFRQSMACSDKALCGSRNQEVVFFTNRYSSADLMPQGFEVTIGADGRGAVITGFPPPTL